MQMRMGKFQFIYYQDFINQRMRPSLHNTDMDFRVIPSAIPLQSPSPDKKNANNITPTVSPSPIEIKKNITPIKRNRIQKQNTKYQPDRSTDMKYATHSPGMDYCSALKQKQQVIRNLKHIIDLITENGRKNVHDEAEENDLRKQIKILTIQNQKLVNIVEKMSKNKQHKPQETIKVQQRYEKQIGELMQTMKISKQEHQDEQRELKRLYKALNIHCRSIESEKKQLQIENQKLLKILKDKKESEKKINQKSRVSEGSEGESEKSFKNQKLSLSKIKQQYAENMKMLRDGLIKQIEQTFDTMRIALEGMGSKATHLGIRVDSIEKVVWQRLRNKKQYQDLGEQLQEMGKHRKSQIYIQQGPDSSHPSHQTSKDEVIDSRSSSNELRQQLAKTKAQLEQLRFKYDKMCLDTSTVQYSKRVIVDQKEWGQQYQKMIQNIEKKDKQIQILYQQIKNIQQQNLEASRQRYGQWEQMMENKQRTITQLKQNHLVEIEEIKGQMELKVKLLVENYDKQIQLLKKQIILKNTDLHEATQVSQIHHSDSTKKIQDLQNIINQLKQNIEEVNKKLEISENRLQQQKVQFEINEQSWQRQKKSLKQRFQDLQNLSKTDRTKRQQIEQEVILQMVELSQYKREAEQSKQLAKQKCDQLESLFNDRISQLQLNIKIQKQEKETIQSQIQSKNACILQMKDLLEQYKKNYILEQINQLHQYTQQQIDKNRNLTIYQFEKDDENGQIKKLAEQINETRQILMEKQEKCIQQQARIIELEGLCELNRTKFEEQQALHLQLLSKYKEVESKESILSSRLKDSSYEEVLGKISQLRQLEQERVRKINDFLQK